MAAVVSGVPVQRRHVTVSVGTVVPPAETYNSPPKLRALVDGLLGEEIPAWSTFNAEHLYDEFRNTGLCVFLVDGLLAKDARAINRELLPLEEYRGALEARFDNELNWAFYRVPMVYRIVGDELRVFYRSYDLAVEDNRDHIAFQGWKGSGLFSQVDWEDASLRQTIFDPYSEYAHYRVSGELRALVEGQLGHVVDEIFLRVAQLDPRLVQPFHGALKAFENLDTADSLAHVAVSTRRLLEQLADVLYPPRDGRINGRKVGKVETKNRLWAYVADSLEPGTRQQVILASVADVGNRVDSLHALANKGLHFEIDSQESQRLLVGLVVLIYDLLTLSPPTKSPSTLPYTESVRDFAQKAVREDDRSGGSAE